MSFLFFLPLNTVSVYDCMGDYVIFLYIKISTLETFFSKMKSYVIR